MATPAAQNSATPPAASSSPVETTTPAAPVSVPESTTTTTKAPLNTPPKGKKLRKINKPKKSNAKLLWLAGHVLTLGFGIFYTIFYIQRKAQHNLIPLLSYKLALVGVWLSYTVSIQSQYNLKSLPHYTTLLSTENFQYLLLSIVWFFNRSSFFKILPFIIVSILQLSSTFNLKAILKFEQKLSAVVLYNELFLFLLLFVDTLLFRGTSGYGLVVYCMFMWLRVLQNENTRFFLYDNLVKLDKYVSKVKNEKVQKIWKDMKTFLTYKQARFEQKYL